MIYVTSLLKTTLSIIPINTDIFEINLKLLQYETLEKLVTYTIGVYLFFSQKFATSLLILFEVLNIVFLVCSTFLIQADTFW